MFASLSEVAELQQIEEENEEVDEEQHDEEMQDQDEKNQSLEKAAALSDAKVDLPIQSTASVTVPNPFEPRASNIERAVSPPKRKHEGSEAPLNPKRQELEKKEPAAASAPVVQAEGGEEESDSDSDGSVHLNMELEEDEEDEDDDE